jgi:hypothetical protein
VPADEEAGGGEGDEGAPKEGPEEREGSRFDIVVGGGRRGQWGEGEERSRRWRGYTVWKWYEHGGTGRGGSLSLPIVLFNAVPLHASYFCADVKGVSVCTW